MVWLYIHVLADSCESKGTDSESTLLNGGGGGVRYCFGWRGIGVLQSNMLTERLWKIASLFKVKTQLALPVFSWAL